MFDINYVVPSLRFFGKHYCFESAELSQRDSLKHEVFLDLKKTVHVTEIRGIFIDFLS